MTRMLRSRITYANVMSTLAVFIALGGGAWAVNGGHQARLSLPVSRTVSGSAGHLASPSGEFTLDVNNNGIKLADHNRPGYTIELRNNGIGLFDSRTTQPVSLKLQSGAVELDAFNGSMFLFARRHLHMRGTDAVNLTSGTVNEKQLTGTGDMSLDVGRDLFTKSQSSNATITNILSTAVGGAWVSTVGGVVSSTVGGDLTSFVGGNTNTTIKGNDTITAIGSTLDTTAGTITNNADFIRNAADGNLDNHAGSNLTNTADGSLINASGTNLTNQAGGDLLNDARHNLTNQAGDGLTDKANGGDLTAQATGQEILSAPTVHVGCASGAGGARLGDPVSAGQISGASTRVFVC